MATDPTIPVLEREVERLRAELDAIGDLAYRADPTSPFVSDVLHQIYTRAKVAAQQAPDHTEEKP